ncbi:MAG: ornithine acetyltransferase [Caldimicrobium thiodismutans]|uniref:Arginine biosynthesis bifunctional protein ArgJ n=1 Tax=Caldimicrobium thiodismutans TaxID=1653476 RepID=A0A2N7PJX4_9BACT|nr:MAG: ornithine acetyltransferase [Caldimicrobium thiodismutans]
MNIPQGFLFAGVSAGIRKEGRLDLGLIFCEEKGISWGVFTKNTVKAAPVLIGKKHIKNLVTRAILVNSGIANACTGKEGLERTERVLKALSDLLSIKKEEILPASTGVIGEQLPEEKIIAKLPDLVKKLSPSNYADFAKAIMTTDTFPKISSQLTGDGIAILGIAKGAGMIAPHMATMLAFILTDAKIDKKDLQTLLLKAVEESFNRITVDSDTSTNDTVYALASGKKEIGNWEEFCEKFQRVLYELSYMIVKDGEGASKVIKVIVKGAKTKEEAKNFSQAVANSLLVKTAFYGGDPNWGRILAALGKTQIPFDPEEIEIYLNGIPWIKKLKTQNKEEVLKNELRKNDIELLIKLKRGKQNYWMLTCDLTEEYIKINASYRS